MRSIFRAGAGMALVLASACAPDAANAPLPTEPAPRGPTPVGVYEIAITGLGTGELRSTVGVPRAPGGGASRDLVSAGGGITFEQIASSSFTEGARAQGGQRYVSFTYRVRNGTGAPLQNLTLLLVRRAGTIGATPISTLRRFDGTDADAGLAAAVVPTGAVGMKSDALTMQALYPDVVQAFTEAEVAAVPRPGDVTDVFPYGYVVRNADPAAATRTLPATTDLNRFDGVMTVAFRLPLQATAQEDAFSFFFQVLAVQDGETRLTETVEEAQDTAAVRRLRGRAAALGATTVTVLPGSENVAAYPGQRQICALRTAGSAASPTTYVTAPGAYTRLAILRDGESPSACGAGFRAGTATAPVPGTPYPVSVYAMDRYGNRLAGIADTVALTRVSGPAATIGGGAVPLASGGAAFSVTWGAYGSAVLAAAGRRVRAERQMDLAPRVYPTLYSGDNQAAMAGMPVPTRPGVVVKDAAGTLMANIPVTFSVTSGGGTVTGATTLTDSAGVARVGSWTLGVPANLNTLTATVAGATAPITFRAAACGGGGGVGYQITLCWTYAPTPSQRAALEAAAARWERVIQDDVPDIAFAQNVGDCQAGSPSFNLSIDDLLILVVAEAVDGPGGSPGSAGPCWARDENLLPFAGRIRFDTADLPTMEANGTFANYALHQMGHVVGFGLMWSYFGLLTNPSSVSGPVVDTYYNGVYGRAGFDAIGGTAYTAGQKVPVENTGGAQRINNHWREPVLGGELMSSTILPGTMPMSLVTVRSLQDLGYVVRLSAADPVTFTPSLRADALVAGTAGTALPVGDDADPGPVRTAGRRGRRAP